ncbi:MAG: glycosyltransferase family 39 protein [Patescibacteria group bacterium]
MGQFRSYLIDNRRVISWSVLGVAGLSWLLLYKLGTLTYGMSASEIGASSQAVGWHGIYGQAFYLPLKLVRSLVFALFTDHGQFLSRLPNVVFGALSMVSFACLIKLWHGTRTAIMASLMFMTSAWVLHVSRLASFDVLYLWAMPTLLLIQVLLHKYAERLIVLLGSLLAWGLMLYVPGLVWLVALSIYMSRHQLQTAWKHFGGWQRSLYIVLFLAGVSLLVFDMLKFGGLAVWLGLPSHFVGVLEFAKGFVAVPIHLFIRGPQYPEIWLDRLPIMDIFTLVVCVIGIYFYATHPKAARTRLLALFGATGVVLVGPGGAAGLSLLVPLLYVAAATGIAYLVHEWLQTFPKNPLARGLGLGLISLAIGLSCIYNLRSYFVAWPHNPTTQAVFQYRR